MTSHLIPLSLTRQVPACRVPRLSENMATVLGLKCVLALGFKRDSKAFANQVRAIVRKVPRCHVPWMPRPGGSATALATDSESQESASEGEPSQSHKRKLDEVPQEASELRTPKAPLLQPLRVRRVVPNPKKVRKPKLKEKSKGK
ncbi:RPP38 protein, partial [Amia calva]|nr:RPP38 protein [Amia calva]